MAQRAFVSAVQRASSSKIIPRLSTSAALGHAELRCHAARMQPQQESVIRANFTDAQPAVARDARDPRIHAPSGHGGLGGCVGREK